MEIASDFPRATREAAGECLRLAGDHGGARKEESRKRKETARRAVKWSLLETGDGVGDDFRKRQVTAQTWSMH